MFISIRKILVVIYAIHILIGLPLGETAPSRPYVDVYGKPYGNPNYNNQGPKPFEVSVFKLYDNPLPFGNQRLSNLNDNKQWEQFNERLNMTAKERYRSFVKQQWAQMTPQSRESWKNARIASREEYKKFQRDLESMQRQQKYWQEQQDLMQRIMSRQAATPENYNDQGVVFAQTGQTDQAISSFTQAININSGNALTYYNRGVEYLKKGHFDAAYSDLTSAVNFDPQMAEAYVSRGVAAWMKDYNNQALEDFNKAISIDNTKAIAYACRSYIYFEKGKYQSAFSDASRLIEISPKQASGYMLRGKVHYVFNRFEQAIADYDSGIGLNPEMASLHMLKAFAEYKLDRYQNAISDATKALMIDSNLVRAYLVRAMSYSALDQKTDALYDLDDLIEINPKNSAAYLLRCNLHHRLSKPELAIADADKYLSIVSSSELDYRAYALKGVSYDILGQHQKAIVAYRQFLQGPAGEHRKERDLITKRLSELGG